MNRNIGRVAWAVFGLILAFVSQYVHAETIGATAVQNPVVQGWNKNNTFVLTQAEACSGYGSVYVPYSSTDTDGQCICHGSGNGCFYDGHTVGVTRAESCGGSGNPITSTACMSYTCPANQGWTLSGQTCTRPDCVAPAVRQSDGSCHYPCNSVAGASAMPSGVQAWGVTGSSSACGGGVSVMGCATTCKSGVSGGGKASCTGCTFTGTNSPAGATQADAISASSPTTPETPQSCMAAGKSYATMAGTTVCVASGSPTAATTEATNFKTTTTTPASGPATTTSQQTTTTTGPNNTVTQTVTTTNPDNTTSTVKTDSSASQFCTDHPTDPSCLTQQAKKECEDNPDRVGCKDLGEAPAAPEINTQTVPLSFAPIAISQNATCPAPIPLSLGGRSMNIEFDGACTYASGLRPIVIAVAYLTAAFIVFGIGRSDG